MAHFRDVLVDLTYLTWLIVDLTYLMWLISSMYLLI